MTKTDIIELIDRHWRFDESQDHTSTWHDKQDLISEIALLFIHTIDTPKERAEEIVNLIISNTASQYSEEWKPDIVYTKEQLIEFVQSFAKQEVERACEKQRKIGTDNLTSLWIHIGDMRKIVLSDLDENNDLYLTSPIKQLVSVIMSNGFTDIMDELKLLIDKK